MFHCFEEVKVGVRVAVYRERAQTGDHQNVGRHSSGIAHSRLLRSALDSEFAVCPTASGSEVTRQYGLYCSGCTATLLDVAAKIHGTLGLFYELTLLSY